MVKVLPSSNIFYITNYSYCTDNLQSWAKYLTKSYKIKQNWKRPRNFELYFCVSFDYWRQNTIIAEETGHWSVCPPDFKMYR